MSHSNSHSSHSSHHLATNLLATASRFYSAKQLQTLNRLGDVLIPASADFPSFSQVGCVVHIDDVMTAADKQDIKDFGTLLSVMHYLPTFVLAGIIKLSLAANKTPSIIAPILRQLDIAIRGVIYTLYYANQTGLGYQGKTAYDAIDYHVACRPDSDEPHAGDVLP